MQITVKLTAGQRVKQGTAGSYALLLSTGAAAAVEMWLLSGSNELEYVRTASKGLKARLGGGQRFDRVELRAAVDCDVELIISDGLVDISTTDGANVNATITGPLPLPVSSPSALSVQQLDTLLMETGVGAVVAGAGPAGWVSGNPAGAAASTNVTVVFDMGSNWKKYGLLALIVLPNTFDWTGFEVSGSDTVTFNGARRLKDQASVGLAALYVATVSNASGGQQVFLRAMGRYVVARFTTAAGGAQGAAAKVTLAAYPH